MYEISNIDQFRCFYVAAGGGMLVRRSMLWLIDTVKFRKRTYTEIIVLTQRRSWLSRKCFLIESKATKIGIEQLPTKTIDVVFTISRKYRHISAGDTKSHDRSCWTRAPMSLMPFSSSNPWKVSRNLLCSKWSSVARKAASPVSRAPKAKHIVLLQWRVTLASHGKL